MVTNLTPTTISTPPPPGGDSGFTMDPAAMDTLQQQAGDLRTGYEEVSSKLSGQVLAGNAFGTAGTFAVEAFNASNTRSVELTGKAAATLGLVGDGLKATAQTQQEADRASGEQFATVEPAMITEGPRGAPAGGSAGTPTPQGPPVTPTQEIPGGSGSGSGNASPTPGPQVPPTTDVPGANGTTQASAYTETPAGQSGTPTGQGSGTPTGQGGGAPTGQAAGTPTGQMPPTPPMPGTPTADSPTKPSTPAGAPTANGAGSAGAPDTAAARTSAPPPQATTPQAAPIPDFPEIPDPPPVPNGSGGGATPSANTTPPPTPPIPEVPKDLFKQPGIPDLGTGGGSTGGGSPSPTTPGATTPAGSTTPPPMPPIPEVPKDLFKQPGTPDLGTSGGSTGGATTPTGGTTPPPMPPIPEVPKDLFKQTGIPDLGTGGGTGTAGGSSGGGAGTPSAPDLDDRRPGEQSSGERGGRDGSDHERPGRDREGGEHRDHDGGDRAEGGHGGGADDVVRGERDQHGFPITSVDGKPCLDLRDLPAEEGERWQENIRDILATKGEGSFFWAGDTIDAEGQRHSLMDLAEFMTNLDGRVEPGADPGEAGRPERELSDDVAASPARSASGDVYVLVGPNRADDDPVELADFPTLQANPRVERVFAIDAVTGRETQLHPKVA
ncbi:hypothetical protein ACQPYE_15085 [Actinosynnema sp. CA-299493]